MNLRTSLIAGLGLALVAAAVWPWLAGPAPAPAAHDTVGPAADAEAGSPDLESAEIVRERSTPEGERAPPTAGEADAARVDCVGRVVDGFAAPIAGAEVTVSRLGSRTAAARVTTGADGRFALSLDSPANLTILAQARKDGFAPGLANRTRPAGSGPLDLGDIQLTRGGSVTGRVVDGRGGAIPGARVTLAPTAGNPLAWAPDREEILAPLTTDAAGFFTAEHFGAGSYRVTAEAAGFRRGGAEGPVDVVDEREEDVGVIVLDDGTSLAGRVTDLAGAPIEGARIRLRSTTEPRTTEQARTDAEGSFRLDHLPLGLAHVEVGATGYLTWRQDGIDAAATPHLAVRLEPGLAITGTVIDAATGAPVTVFAAKARRMRDLPAPGASDPHGVRGPELGIAPPQLLEGFRSTRVIERPRGRPRDLAEPASHPGGAFEFDGLDEGVYVVDVAAPGYLHERSALVELSAAARPGPVVVRLQSGLVLGGTITALADGEPVANASVQLRVPRDGAPAPPGLNRGRLADTVSTARSDRHGEFRFDDAPRGEVFVVVRASGYATAETDPFELVADREDLAVELAATATLAGTVRGIPSASEEAAHVLVYGGAGRMRTGQVEADGRYRLEGLEPGAYLVRAFTGPVGNYVAHRLGRLLSSRGAPPTDVTLRAGEEATLDLTLDEVPLGTVRGTVTVNGQPAAGFRVSVRRTGNDPLVWRSTRGAAVDANGAFELSGVGAGEYLLIVNAPAVDGRAWVHSERIAVFADRVHETVLDLRTGALEGTVVAADGTDAAELDGAVRAVPQGGSGEPITIKIRRGKFRQGCVRAGAYTLEVSIERRETTRHDVQVTAGSTATAVVQAGAKSAPR